MLTIKVIKPDMPELVQLKALYNRAFPINERRPLEPLLREQQGVSDVLVFEDGDVFVGFACLLTWRDLTHIIYFAIQDDLRNRGYGSSALQLMAQRYPGQRMLVDVEAADPHASNDVERKRRRDFYLRNGYIVTSVCYGWRQEKWEILSYGGDVSEAEFNRFWKAMGRAGLAAY